MRKLGNIAPVATWRLYGVLIGTIASPASAQTQPNGWLTITQPGGYPVAKIATAGKLAGMALTCEGKVPVLALALAQSPRRNPAQLTLSSGSATANIGIARNGSTAVWAAAVRDARVLDMLAKDQSVRVTIDGAEYGVVPMAGASAAMRGALTGCYQPSATVASTRAAAPVADGSDDADEAFVRADIARIYGYRDGQPVTNRYSDPSVRFASSLRAVFDACNEALGAATAIDAEKAYDASGDQGCMEHLAFTADQTMGDESDFEHTWVPALKRVSAATIDAVLPVPAAKRSDYALDTLTLRYVRVGDDWLVGDSGATYQGQLTWLSAAAAEKTADLRKIKAHPARR